MRVEDRRVRWLQKKVYLRMHRYILGGSVFDFSVQKRCGLQLENTTEGGWRTLQTIIPMYSYASLIANDKPCNQKRFMCVTEKGASSCHFVLVVNFIQSCLV